MVKPNKKYKVHSVRKGTSSAGAYTIVKISDSTMNKDGTFTKEYFSIFVNSDFDVYSNADIVFTQIDGVRKKTSDYNGKTYVEVTIFVSPDNFEVESVGDAPKDEVPNNIMKRIEEDLPF